jgi:hypothetical protein
MERHTCVPRAGGPAARAPRPRKPANPSPTQSARRGACGARKFILRTPPPRTAASTARTRSVRTPAHHSPGSHSSSSRACRGTRPIAKLAAATAAAQRASLARAPTQACLGRTVRRRPRARPRAREEAAEFRANDATVGADAVVAGAATAERPAPRTYRTRAVRAAEAADTAGGGGTGLGEEGGGGTERKPRGPLRPTADGPVELTRACLGRGAGRVVGSGRVYPAPTAPTPSTATARPCGRVTGS